MNYNDVIQMLNTKKIKVYRGETLASGRTIQIFHNGQVYVEGKQLYGQEKMDFVSLYYPSGLKNRRVVFMNTHTEVMINSNSAA